MRQIQIESPTDVVRLVDQGYCDPVLVELSNSLERRDEARKEALHQQIQQVYGDEYEISVRKREQSDLPRMSLSRRVAVSPADVRELVELAVARASSFGDLNAEVTLDYEDAMGNTTSRVVRAIRLESKWGRDYLVAYDIAKDEPRQFRLDRIERAEVDW